MDLNALKSLLNGLTIKELERNLGFSNGSIAKWEKSFPSVDKVMKVADYFGVTAEFLLTGKKLPDDVVSVFMVERILGLIAESGITAKELTERTGLNHSAISDWKKGKSKPGTDAVIKLAKYFDVSTDYLLMGEDPHKRHSVSMDEDARDIEIAVKAYFLKLGRSEVTPNMNIGLSSKRISEIRNNESQPTYAEFWYMLNILDPEYKGNIIPAICHQVLGILYNRIQQEEKQKSDSGIATAAFEQFEESIPCLDTASQVVE